MISHAERSIIRGRNSKYGSVGGVELQRQRHCLNVNEFEMYECIVLLIAPECCQPFPLKIGVLSSRGGSTLEQWIIDIACRQKGKQPGEKRHGGKKDTAWPAARTMMWVPTRGIHHERKGMLDARSIVHATCYHTISLL